VAKPKSKFGSAEHEITLETVYGPFTLRRPSMFLRQQMHLESARSTSGVTGMDALGELYTIFMAQATTYARTDDQIRRAAFSEKPYGWPEGFTWATAYDEDFLPDLIKRFNDWLESFRKPAEPDAGQEGSAGRVPDSVVRDSPEVQLGSNGPASAGDDGRGDGA
jgi:hypothetical protein